VPYKRDEEQPLLSGGQATVFRATRTSPPIGLRRKVETFAIKEILIKDKRARHRLRKEIEHLRLCQHPNVLQLKEVYTIEQEEWMDRTFLVTQPWAQASLQRLLEDIANSSDGTSRLCPWYKPHNLDPWPSIVRQCILGLEHLHNNEIRHKDLKPDNILLVDESDGDSLKSKVRVIIADLGISKGYVEAEKTTFNGTEQYLAPEQKAEASSTYRSDIFSLGCSISWIHALLSSKQWELCKGNELGIFQLEELYQVGFCYSFKEVPPLLRRLRQDPDGAKQQDMVDFLVTLEDIITSTLLEEPDERPGLQRLLERLDAYNASWLQSETFKILDLCITSGSHTEVLEIDLSTVRNDEEAFDLIKKHYSMATCYYNFDWLRSLSAVDFIKFSSTNTFRVLEYRSKPLPTNVQAGEYDMYTTINPFIDADFLLHRLRISSTYDRLSHFLLRRLPTSSAHDRLLSTIVFIALPKRRLTIHHHRDGSHTVSTIQDPRWGVQIVKKFSPSPVLVALTFTSVPYLAAYFFSYLKLSLQDALSVLAICISLLSFLQTVMLSANRRWPLY
jgi:serine/threonine protein kinase